MEDLKLEAIKIELDKFAFDISCFRCFQSLSIAMFTMQCYVYIEQRSKL